MTTHKRWSKLLHITPLAVAVQFVDPAAALAQQAPGSTLPPVTVEGSTPRAARAAPKQRASSRSASARRAPAPQPQAPVAVTPRETARGPVRGIVAQRSATGTKTDASLLETPQSISVVTKDQMQQQGARTVAEALRYEPGVISESRVGDRFDNVFIRGFGGFGGNANYLHFWDGLRLPRGVSYAMPSVDPYLLERVEILRGPASVLYGQNNLGGMVNLVSKRPTATAQGEIFTRFGDHNRIEGGFDVSGPLTKDGDLLYRLIGLGRKADTEVDYTTTERQLIAPTITWRPSTDTSLTVSASYSKDPSNYQPNWLPALGTLQANPNGQIPKNFFSGHPNVNTYTREQTSVGYEFEHHFNETWAVRQNFRYMEVSSDFKALSVPPGGATYGAGATCGAGATANLCLIRSSTNFIERLKSTAIDTQAEAKFATGWLQHTVLMGIDYQTSSASAQSGTGAAATVTNINYLNPNYGTLVPPPLTSQTITDREQAGIYLQDQVRIGKLAVVAGVRNDWANGTNQVSTLATGAINSTIRPSSSAATWRVGATYLFDNGFAPYASYSTSFEPSIAVGTDYTGKAFDPTTGEQYEVGIKYQPVGLNGFFMLSYFDITQNNLLALDTAHSAAAFPLCTASGTSCQTQIGQVQSKGIELSGKITLQPGFDVIAAYSHTDIDITRSNQVVSGISLQGKKPVGAAADTSSLWMDYTFQSGALAGFGFGGGVRYIGSSYGDNINSAAMIVPAYTLGDAQIHYDLAGASPQLKGWKLSVNMTNIADKTYVSACASANQCFYGNGRTTLGTVRYQW